MHPDSPGRPIRRRYCHPRRLTALACRSRREWTPPRPGRSQRQRFAAPNVTGRGPNAHRPVLRQPGAVAVEALLARIQKAVDGYDARLVASGDAFAASRPKRARLHTWAIIYDGGGKQMPHMHPAGWITGVYYVSSPRAPGENAHRGPIVLGADRPIKDCAAFPWGLREIEPVPGRLVMFPSHVPHSTIPPGGANGERICVTFDVVDAAAA